MQLCVPLFSYKPTISLETREIQKSTVHTLSIALSRGGKSPFPLHCWPRWILDGHLGICWIFQWQADHIQRGLGRCNAKVAAQISKTLWGEDESNDLDLTIIDHQWPFRIEEGLRHSISLEIQLSTVTVRLQEAAR